ncbi:MAG TPA: hypothetical protein VD930_04540 [Gemmatimonadales bacterium]|nr:hypothetical protein [Gemmatimonadales bacterium]
MRKLFFLVAMVAFSAACHNRSEEEVGAAPDEGQTDTTGVTHAIDSTRTGPPGMQGRPGNATVTPDSVGIDSAAVQGGDTTMDQDTGMTSVPQDTLGPRDPNAPAYGDTTGMQTDTTTMQGDTGTMQSDTTMTDTTSTSQ